MPRPEKNRGGGGGNNIQDKSGFVFHDPLNIRWKRFKRISVLFLFLGFFISLATLLTFVSLPNLPALKSSLNKTNKIAVKPKGTREKSFEIQKKELLAESRNSRAKPTKGVSPGGEKLMAFLVNWDDTSMTSLRENYQKIGYLLPEWLHLKPDGSLGQDDQGREEIARKFIQRRAAEIKIVPMVNNFSLNNADEWGVKNIDSMLFDKTKRKKIIADVVNYLNIANDFGVCLDLENLSPKAKVAYPEFLTEMKKNLGDKKIFVTVPAADESFEYKKIGEVADAVLVMAYDEHWSTSEAGPIASQLWFNKVVTERSREIPGEKMVVVLGNYGYDWKSKGVSQTVSFQEATRIAKESEGEITFEPNSLNPTFEYEEDGTIHTVYFLDAITSYNQIVDLKNIPHQNIALWRLGSEDPGFWNIQDGVASLENSKYGYDVDYEGRGSILKVIQSPQTGQRKLKVDSDLGLITEEKYLSFPSPYVISRYGFAPKKIVLTFDDGPDPVYTDKILDVLKSKGVKATFFVIGQAAENNPSVLERIYKEGQEIASHTFSHPNISRLPESVLALELNTTQRLLESRLGINTLLFRPPYAEDIEPATPGEVKPLFEVDKHGYYTVGIDIDPNDWRNPGTDKIVENTLKLAKDKDGGVVLLHDSGGDRSQTLEALPKIIDSLREAGFEFTSIPGLMGKTREELMPKSQTPEYVSMTDWFSFWLMNFWGSTVHWIFLLATGAGIIRYFLVIILAILAKLKQLIKPVKLDWSYTPKVSVIIPCFNEEKVVAMTMASVANCDYPNLEIMVVNDGSTDKTLDVARQEAKKHHGVVVLDKTNSGKADSINLALSKCEGEIVVILDADTILNKNALRHLVQPFKNPRVGAVAGNAKVGNRVNPLTKMQSVEYITAQNLDRRAWSLFEVVTVVPGAIGAWRKKVIWNQLGGFPTNTLAEDADLTYGVQALGLETAYEEKAIAYTEAPEKLSSFIKQRFRWMFGTLQVAYKHRGSAWDKKARKLLLVVYPNVIIFQIIFPILSPLVDVYALLLLLVPVYRMVVYNIAIVDFGFLIPLLYFGVFLGMDVMSALVAFYLEKTESKKAILWLVVQRIFLRQVMYLIALKTVLAMLRGELVGWNKFSRSAGVKLS